MLLGELLLLLLSRLLLLALLLQVQLLLQLRLVPLLLLQLRLVPVLMLHLLRLLQLLLLLLLVAEPLLLGLVWWFLLHSDIFSFLLRFGFPPPFLLARATAAVAAVAMGLLRRVMYSQSLCCSTVNLAHWPARANSL